MDFNVGPVPDLLLCLGVLKHRAPLAMEGGGVDIVLPKFFFTMDFCLCGAILNLNAFCVGLPGLPPSGSMKGAS